MDYMEIPPIPKGMLEKLLAMTSGSYRANGPIRNGYNLPIFNSAKTVSPSLPKSASVPTAVSSSASVPASDLPRRESMLPFPPFPGSHEAIANAVSGASGVAPLQKAGSGSLFHGEEAMEKVKQKRQRVRKSRASGTPRKRIKAEPAVDATTVAGTAQLQAGAPAPAPPSRRRARAKAASNGGEKAEKPPPPPRRRNRQASNKGKTKEAQVGAAVKNELPPLSTAPNLGHPEPGTNGVLGIYGLNTKALDLARYMEDVSLQELMSGNLKPAPAASKQDVPPKDVGEDSFAKRMSSILQILSKPGNAEHFQPRNPANQQMECRPQKLMLDLESTPQPEDEEGPSLVHRRMEPCPNMKVCSDASAAGRGQPSEEPHLFSSDSLPLFPLTEFLSSLNLPPPAPLGSLLSQATAVAESRAVPPQTGSSRAGSFYSKNRSLPPLPFSFKSAQTLQDDGCDRNPWANRWFRAGSPKRESSETWFGDRRDAGLQGSRLPIKIESGGDSGKLGTKEGFMDIDLNKQSPEAEEADTIRSSSTSTLQPEAAAHAALEATPLASTQQSRMNTDAERPQTACVNEMEVDGRAGDEPAFKQQPEVAFKVPSKVIDGSDVSDMSQKLVTVIEGGSIQEEEAVLDGGSGKREERQCETQKDLPAVVSSGLPRLLFKSGHQSQDPWNDAPCSPGVQAAAKLLCKMANSSSPFYMEKDERRRKTSLYTEAPVQRFPKAARVGGPNETVARIHKQVHHGNESGEDGVPLKVLVGEGRNKLLSQVVNGSSASVVDKADGSSLAHARQRLHAPPSRSVPKGIAAAKITGNFSSDSSDRSPDRAFREHSGSTSVEVHGNKSTGTFPPPPVASIKIPTPVMKGARGSHATVCPPAPPATKGSPVFDQRKSPIACESQHFIHGQRLTKTSRPRSKNTLPLHRSATSYPVKSRNPIGCPVKSVRQILPFLGEIRQGTKRLL